MKDGSEDGRQTRTRGKNQVRYLVWCVFFEESRAGTRRKIIAARAYALAATDNDSSKDILMTIHL
jgi:hypothetical protein